MRKEFVDNLKKKAEEVAKNFSNSDREYNYNKELFSVDKIIPLSETTAAVIFDKQPTGKKAVIFCYVIKSDGEWRFFFPTYDHLAGLGKITDILQQIEAFNFEKN